MNCTARAAGEKERTEHPPRDTTFGALASTYMWYYVNLRQPLTFDGCLMAASFMASWGVLSPHTENGLSPMMLWQSILCERVAEIRVSLETLAEEVEGPRLRIERQHVVSWRPGPPAKKLETPL